MPAIGIRETASAQLTLLIVDDRTCVGQGLKSLLQNDPAIRSVDWVRDAALLEMELRSSRPDVILMNLSTRRRSPVGVIATIGRTPEPPAVVVLVDSPRSAAALEAVQAGAVSVVSMTDSPEELIDAVKAARRGVGRMPAALLRALLSDVPGPEDPTTAALTSLTRREREVLALLASGHDRRSIAVRLYCSPETVRTHIRSVLTKLNAHSTVEAAALAVRLGVDRG